MNHYELVLLLHPNHGEKVASIISTCREIIEKKRGIVHRLEEWGARPLAYQIKKVSRAFYVLINIECPIDALNELNDMIKFNESILRSLVTREKQAITEESIVKKQESIQKQQ